METLSGGRDPRATSSRRQEEPAGKLEKKKERKAGALGAAPPKARSTRGRGTGLTENAMLRREQVCECTQVGRQLTGAPSDRLKRLNCCVLQAAPGGKNPARRASPAGGWGWGGEKMGRGRAGRGTAMVFFFKLF